MKKSDVSGYLHPDQRQVDAAQNGATNRPKRDITYSVVLGYGFRPSLMSHDRDSKAAKEQR